jgi:hypothetical protein
MIPPGLEVLTTGMETAVEPPPLPPEPPEEAADSVGTETALAVVEPTGAAAEVAGALPPPEGGEAGTPHAPRGLFPGNFSMTPVICSLIALGMLHEVPGSLSPPIRPGHLSIPASPALQLSMTCCRVVTSQPAIYELLA